MSHLIQIEISDPLFHAIERQATAVGSDPATVAVTTLQQHFQVPGAKAGDGGADSFEALFGTLDLGYPTGLNNDQIDADLVREYGRGLDD